MVLLFHFPLINGISKIKVSRTSDSVITIGMDPAIKLPSNMTPDNIINPTPPSILVGVHRKGEGIK